MVSASQEDYLSAIYRLGDDDRATTGQIADALGISQASVTNFLKKASSEGLVHHEAHRGARLTEEGRREALKVIRRHRVVERFLVDVLDLAWDRVDDEAHRLEHAVSDVVIDRMEELLDDADHCPHGYPIPDEGLAVSTEPGRPLTDLEPGSEVEIVRVDETPELLRYLAERDLYPGTRLTVVDRHPFDGPLEVERADEQITLGYKVADRIVVREADR